MRTLSLASGMSSRPSMRGNCRSSICSSTTLAVGLGEPSGLRCCAIDGMAVAIAIKIAATPTKRRMLARGIVMIILLPNRRTQILAWRRMRRGSHRDPLVIGSRPAPGAGAVAALGDALLIDLGDDLAVSG